MMKFGEYKEYKYEPNEEGALIAEMTGTRGKFYTNAQLKVHHEKVAYLNVEKTVYLTYNKYNKTYHYKCDLGYGEKDYEELKRKNGYTECLNEHVLRGAINSAYGHYKNKRRK